MHNVGGELLLMGILRSSHTRSSRKFAKNVLTINRKFIRNSSLLANNMLVRQQMRRKEK
jgi:hypothetical protein